MNPKKLPKVSTEILPKIVQPYYYSLRPTPCFYICTAADLDHLEKIIMEQPEIAICTKICNVGSSKFISVISISTNAADYVIDVQLTIKNCILFMRNIFGNEHLVKVLADCTSQILELHNQFNIPIMSGSQTIIDLLIACKIMGLRADSYPIVFEQVLGLKFVDFLNGKSTDYTQRPLFCDQILNMANQTHGMLMVWDKIRQKLTEMVWAGYPWNANVLSTKIIRDSNNTIDFNNFIDTPQKNEEKILFIEGSPNIKCEDLDKIIKTDCKPQNNEDKTILKEFEQIASQKQIMPETIIGTNFSENSNKNNIDFYKSIINLILEIINIHRLNENSTFIEEIPIPQISSKISKIPNFIEENEDSDSKNPPWSLEEIYQLARKNKKSKKSSEHGSEPPIIGKRLESNILEILEECGLNKREDFSKEKNGIQNEKNYIINGNSKSPKRNYRKRLGWKNNEGY